MLTPDGAAGQPTVPGLVRPILVYVGTVTLGTWVFGALLLVQQGSDLAPALAAAAGAMWSVLIWLALFLLVPAMVLTIELVHRLQAGSQAARAAVSAVSWAGWCLFVATTLAVASRVFIVPEWFVSDLILFAAAGAGFGLLALNGHDRRPGRVLAVLALAVVAFVLLGSIWMAGRWGSAV